MKTFGTGNPPNSERSVWMTARQRVVDWIRWEYRGTMYGKLTGNCSAPL